MNKRIYENGIHTISNEQYHGSKGISRSTLMRFKQSPKHYWYDYISGLKEQSKPTPAMVLGEITHLLTLEPELFKQNYAVSPKFRKNTKDGKANHAAFEVANYGKIIIDEEMFALAKCMSDAVKENELGCELIKHAACEKSIYFTHHETGIQCKVRPDAWNGSLVIDLKTTANACYRDFQNSAFKYGYFLQAGMIYEALKSIGQKMDKFVFIAVEKEAPFALGIYTLDDEAIDYGIKQFDALMNELSLCLKINKFGDYGIQTLSVPSYAKFDE